MKIVTWGQKISNSIWDKDRRNIRGKKNKKEREEKNKRKKETEYSKRFSKCNFSLAREMCGTQALRLSTKKTCTPLHCYLYAVYTNEGSVLVSLCRGKRSSARSPARSEHSLLRFLPR